MVPTAHPLVMELHVRNVMRLVIDVKHVLSNKNNAPVLYVTRKVTQLINVYLCSTQHLLQSNGIFQRVQDH